MMFGTIMGLFDTESWNTCKVFHYFFDNSWASKELITLEKLMDFDSFWIVFDWSNLIFLFRSSSSITVIRLAN